MHLLVLQQARGWPEWLCNLHLYYNTSQASCLQPPTILPQSSTRSNKFNTSEEEQLSGVLKKSCYRSQGAREEMAREWSLQETKALVEEHIALKEEKPEVRTASEHWNKVAKKLREKGFNRSYKSCNKKWYRLEQYEVQIISFNMEEGKQKNYWDLSKAERLEFRDKWPQLPSGDGFDKEIFDSLKKFSHQCDKKETSETTDANGACVESKEGIRVEPRVELKRPSAPPSADPVIALPLNSTPWSHPMVTGAELKQQENTSDSQKQLKNTWPAPCEQQPLSSQETLDGFKLQARELRRRRAAELRRSNRTVPYNSTHTTFVKPNQPSSQPNIQKSPPLSGTTTFGSITVVPPPVLTSEATQPGESPAKIARASNVTQTRPQIQFKRVNSNPSPNSYKLETSPAPQDNINGTHLPAHQQPIGSYLYFQHSQKSKTNQQQEHASQGTGHLPLLHSINSHLPLLQPNDSHVGHQISKNGTSSDVHHHGDNLPPELLQLGSLEEQLQVILGVHHGPLQTTQTCEQLHNNMNDHRGPQFHRNGSQNHRENVRNQGSATTSLLGAAIGGLRVQLGAIAKLLQAKNAAEQEFRDKMLLFVECMVVSLHTMAQANVCASF